MEFILEPLQYGFVQRALLVSLLIGAICPVVGIFVVTRGYGFMGDAVAHAVLPGLAAALIARLNPWVGMLPTALGAAALINYMTRRVGILADSSTAIVFAALFALGVVLVSVFAGAITVSIEDLLVGQILGVSATDLYWTLLISAVAALTLAAFFQKLQFVSFDPVGAEVAGINTARMDYLLLGLLAAVVLIAVQSVGVILAVAMIVTPAAAAMSLTRRIQRTIGLSVLFGLTSAVAGLYVSYYQDLPAGPTMTLIATAIFVAAMAFTRRGALLASTSRR